MRAFSFLIFPFHIRVLVLIVALFEGIALFMLVAGLSILLPESQLAFSASWKRGMILNYQHTNDVRKADFDAL